MWGFSCGGNYREIRLFFRLFACTIAAKQPCASVEALLTAPRQLPLAVMRPRLLRKCAWVRRSFVRKWASKASSPSVSASCLIPLLSPFLLLHFVFLSPCSSTSVILKKNNRSRQKVAMALYLPLDARPRAWFPQTSAACLPASSMFDASFFALTHVLRTPATSPKSAELSS